MANVRGNNLVNSNLCSLAFYLIFFCMGAWVGWNVYTLSGARLFFYQIFTPEVFVAACDYGWRDPGTLSGDLYQFAMRSVDTFDCRYFDTVEGFKELGVFAQLQQYLNFSVEFLLNPPILNYKKLWPLPTIAAGFYASGCYLLLRQFFGNLLSVLGTFVLVASPLFALSIMSFRDFSKAPFFIYVIVLVIMLLRSNNVFRSFVLALVAGVVIGIGTGFRVDVSTMLILAIITLLICFDLKRLKLRIFASAVMYTAYVGTTLPLSLDGLGGGWGTVVQQGMSRTFKDNLKLEAPSYELGWMYSDELSLSSIAASERPLNPNWDSQESQPREGFSQAINNSGEHVAKWLPYFVGDSLSQAVKSAYWILAMPSYVAQKEGHRGSGLFFLKGRLMHFYKMLKAPIVFFISFSGLLFLLARSFVNRTDEFLGFIIFFGALLAMPSLQFSLRHVFHLEFFWVIGVLSFLSMPFYIGVFYKLGLKFLLSILFLFMALIITFVLAINYQNSYVKTLFFDLLQLPRAKLEYTKVDDDKETQFLVNLPEQHRAIVDAEHDSMTSDITRYGNQWDVRASASRLILTIKNCPSGNYSVKTHYHKNKQTWQKFDSEINVEIESVDNKVQMLIPAFYRPTQYFKSLSISPIKSDCDFLIEEISGTSIFPYLTTAIFSADWEEENWFYGLGYFD